MGGSKSGGGASKGEGLQGEGGDGSHWEGGQGGAALIQLDLFGVPVVAGVR